MALPFPAPFLVLLLDRSMPVAPAPLPYRLGGTVVCVRCFAPAGWGASRGPGAIGIGRPEKAERNDGGEQVSQVPGEPLCVCARIKDPGGTDTPGPCGASTRPPASSTAKAARGVGWFLCSITGP